MKKLTTTARPVTYLDDYGAEYTPVQQHDYDVVLVPRQRRRKPLSYRLANAVFVGFTLGLIVLVLLVFALDDIDWLMRRGAAALAIILIGGFGLSMLLSFYEELRGLFMTLLGVDDE